MKNLINVFVLCAAILWHASAMATCNDGVDDDGDGLTDYPADPGCYDATDSGEDNPTSVGGIDMPSLQDERDTYALWGWAFTDSDEPDFQSDPDHNPTTNNVDLHGDTEGDDLWSYLMMFIRTNQRGYLDRARAWARYFKEDYRVCVQGTNKQDICNEAAWDYDHFYGWGLLAWYEYTGDPVALAEAEGLGAITEAEYSSAVPGTTDMTWGSGRKPGRHLILATRLAAVTGDARWIALRDKLVDLMMQSPGYHPIGTYHFGDYVTDQKYGAGLYASGVRVLPSFHTGIIAEGLYQVYLSTGRADVRDRIIEMANFMDQYGLDEDCQWAGKTLGANVITGEGWHSYTCDPDGFWEPVYTTSLVNLLAMGAKLSGDTRLYDRAVYFLNRSTKWKSNMPNAPTRVAPDNEVHHFLDSRFASSTLDFYLDYNRGELQYAYLLFDPSIRTPGANTFPSAPTSLSVN